MSNRERLEAEVRRIVSPKPYPMIIERPDDTELKLHIRAISFHDLENATDVLSQLAHGAIYGAFKVKEAGKAMESVEDFEQADIFTEKVITDLRDKLLSFLPWFIKSGTDIKIEDIRDLDYLVTLDIMVEIIRHNFGKRLMDFFARASATIRPLRKGAATAGLTDGLLPKVSLSDEDTEPTASGDGASES